jgi:hypothetical protein
MDASRMLSWIVKVTYKREIIRLGTVSVDEYMVLAPTSRVLKPPAAARDLVPSIGNDVLALINDDRCAFIVNNEIIAVGCDEFSIAYLNDRVTWIGICVTGE